MRLSNLLDVENVFLDVRVASREALVEEVAKRLAARGLVKHPESVAENLLERERLGSTIVEEETAVPHCKVAGLKTIVTAFARTATDIPFGEGKARLFFFVLSPREQPAAHLQVLAAIARLLRNPEARDACRTAVSGEQLLARLGGIDSGGRREEQ